MVKHSVKKIKQPIIYNGWSIYTYTYIHISIHLETSSYLVAYSIYASWKIRLWVCDFCLSAPSQSSILLPCRIDQKATYITCALSYGTCGWENLSLCYFLNLDADVDVYDWCNVLHIYIYMHRLRASIRHHIHTYI